MNNAFHNFIGAMLCVLFVAVFFIAVSLGPGFMIMLLRHWIGR